MDKHIAENLERACRSILVNTRNELYLKMRFLDVALSSFIYIMDWDIYRMGTDGIQMQYHPKDLGGLYREDRVMVNRLYLHTVLHCIFRHLIRRNGREKELHVDEDSFDYGFYSYGLRFYGNMPLIEPQEWKEERKIEEFVIVIDTSMSCSGELVKRFLEETYSALSENNSFFRKVNIHILQCDEQVKEDRKITCGEELKRYMEELTLKGGGGTDFRPAFSYVEDLLKRGELSGLKGLIYFTDGRGIYPAKKPPYQTAFAFVREDYEDVDVPAWAIKLILGEEDLEPYVSDHK